MDTNKEMLEKLLKKEYKSQTKSIRFTNRIWATFLAMAEKSEITPNDLIGQILEMWIADLDKKGLLPPKAKIEHYIQELADEAAKAGRKNKKK
jgi:hypothetical protein